MQITIKSTFDDSDYFVYNYLPKYIYRLVINRLDITKLSLFDDYFKFNSRNIILYALRNLLVTREATYLYNISINKNHWYKGVNISSFIKVLTYGNRELKGYTIVLDTFRYVANNIEDIYMRYSLYVY